MVDPNVESCWLRPMERRHVIYSGGKHTSWKGDLGFAYRRHFHHDTYVYLERSPECYLLLPMGSG
jgi:hypothetical protein